MTRAAGRARPSHEPVMCAEVLAALAPRDEEVFVDGTFGGGGYSRALLAAAQCRVFGIDRDPAALAAGQALAREHEDRLILIEGCFAELESLLAAYGVRTVDGVALDLGVSSLQLDDAARGFSFQTDGPLDMRMAPSGPAARDVVNGADEATLADIIRRYGEERHARRIARAIVARRGHKPIERTRELAELVGAVVPARRAAIHPATRTFQALRIYLNDELGELRAGLPATERLLGAGGRLAVVSFHSLEDRIVKQFLRTRAGLTPRPSRHLPASAGSASPSFKLLFRGARRPGAPEVAANPRARSARLRGGLRTAAPPWPMEAAA